MKKDSVLGLKIAYYRKLSGLTQEGLAERLGVSAQAVSKWEQRQTYPEIMLLPALAGIFQITVDELFGIPAEKAVIYSLVPSVPWPDDGAVRLAAYCGRRLIAQSDCRDGAGNHVFHFTFHGRPYSINGICKFTCKKP